MKDNHSRRFPFFFWLFFKQTATKVKEIIDFEEDFKKKIPSKEQLIKNIHSFNYSKGEKTKQIKETAILKQILIELSLNRQKDINKGNNGTEFIFNSTIEHINDYAKDMEFGNNLGNLLLLEQSKHFNNKPKDEMYDASDITMTKDFSKIVKEFLGDEEKIREYLRKYNISKEELEQDYDKIVNQKVLKDWCSIYDSKYSPSNYGEVKIETQWENWWRGSVDILENILWIEEETPPRTN